MPVRPPQHRHAAWQSREQRNAVWDKATKVQRYVYHTPEWLKARREFLALHPWCKTCGSKANTVDHTIPHRGDMAVFWNKAQWQPLCFPCHQRKRGTE